MVCDHKSLTVINNSFVFSSKIIRECFTGAENDSLYQSTVPLPSLYLEAFRAQGSGSFLLFWLHMSTGQMERIALTEAFLELRIEEASAR